MPKSVQSVKFMDSPDSRFLVAQASSLCSFSSFVHLLFGGCLTLLVLSGCGHRSQISGTINTTDFVIPAGDVVTATADTTINASHKIEIDGTLYVVPGANVEFESPSVNVTGKVQNLAMHAGWWQRTRSVLNRIPPTIMASIDRMLGRQPKYLARGGSVDCLSPPVAAAPSPASNAPGQALHRPGWRWRKPQSEAPAGEARSTGPVPN
jgi:hypothetical protein